MQNLCEIAEVQQKQGQIDQAILSYQAAIEQDPKSFTAYYALGVIYQQQNKLTLALDNYQKVIELLPQASEPYNNLANIYADLYQIPKAIKFYKQAIKLNPDFAAAYYNLGKIYANMGNHSQAQKNYKQALSSNPNYPEAFNNLGNSYYTTGEFQLSIECYTQALKIKPNFAKCYYNLGNAYRDLNNTQQAIANYKKAIEYKPDYQDAIAHLCYLLRKTCDWKNIFELEKHLDCSKTGEPPLANITRCDNLANNYKIASLLSNQLLAKTSGTNCNPFVFSKYKNKIKNKILNIGYISSDFHNHATMHLMRAMFKFHDNKKFKIFFYSYGKNDYSLYRKEAENNCDKFIDLENIDFIEAANIIYNDQVDILVDLKGHTQDNRLEILSLRPAPIQVTYLGFPGTSGASFIDYVITDKTVTLAEDAKYYSEKFVYMPDCYQVNDLYDPSLININNTDIITKKSQGLPDNGIIFCSFNQSYKLDPIMFGIWMEILNVIPNSTLWLLLDCSAVITNLRNYAESYDINPKRLVFANKKNKPEHLARMQLADLALDTRLYNGHTTTSDALRAGIPVITLCGNHFASRVSSSILQCLGLPECITKSLDEYKQLIINLANNPEKIKIFKHKILKQNNISNLFNPKLFALNLEAAYKSMWDCYTQNQAQTIIDLS